MHMSGLFVKTCHKPYSMELIFTLQEIVASLCDGKHDCITVLKTVSKFEAQQNWFLIQALQFPSCLTLGKFLYLYEVHQISFLVNMGVIIAPFHSY